MLDTPVLFLIFNRPAETQIVFDAIKAAKPSKLFVAADGPRKHVPGEEELCDATRKIVLDGQFEGEIITLFREQNLGCANAVSEAITWFFSQVEQGIILEDDCLPNQSFFMFCEELLDKYADNPRIMHIAGCNFQFGRKRSDNSYYFSRCTHIWGWATWKRAWKHYALNINGFSEQKLQEWFKKYRFPNSSFSFWKAAFESVILQKPYTWDYQWTFAIWNNDGLNIIPEQNLVSNIGFNRQGTHTKGTNNPFSNIPAKEITIIKHPAKIEVNNQADIFTFNSWFIKRTLVDRILRRLRPSKF